MHLRRCEAHLTREKCFGRTKYRRSCKKTVALEENSHCSNNLLRLPELPNEIWLKIFDFCIPQKPLNLPEKMTDLDKRVAPADCLGIMSTNRSFHHLVEDLVSSRLSANFVIYPSGEFGVLDQTNIFDCAKPPLLRNLRFRIVIEDTAIDQARCLNSCIEKGDRFDEVDEIQLDFEVGVNRCPSPAKVMEAIQGLISAVDFPFGPSLRITAYYQASARRIFPLDGVSTSREDFNQWVLSSRRGVISA